MSKKGKGLGFSDDELDILSEYGDLLYERSVRQKVGEFIGRSPASVYCKARDLGLISRCKVHSEAFEKEHHWTKRQPNLEVITTHTCPCGKPLYDEIWGDPQHFRLWCICGHSFFFNRDDLKKTGSEATQA